MSKFFLNKKGGALGQYGKIQLNNVSKKTNFVTMLLSDSCFGVSKKISFSMQAQTNKKRMHGNIKIRGNKFRPSLDYLQLYFWP